MPSSRRSAPCWSAAATPWWCMSAATRRRPTGWPNCCCRCTPYGTAAPPGRCGTSLPGKNPMPSTSTIPSCCSVPPWCGPPKRAVCRWCRRCTTSVCSAPTASCCGRVRSARTAPVTAFPARCATGATGAVFCRRWWWRRPTPCTGASAPGGVSPWWPSPTLTGTSCWNSTACALCLMPTGWWSNPTPSVWRRGRYSPGTPAGGSSSLPDGWRN